jgi:hypothetical protein
MVIECFSSSWGQRHWAGTHRLAQQLLVLWLAPPLPDIVHREREEAEHDEAGGHAAADRRAEVARARDHLVPVVALAAGPDARC